MENILNKYLNTQQKHLDALFMLLPEDNLPFSDIKITNNYLQKEISTLIEDINFNKKDYDQKLLVLLKEKHSKVKEANDIFIKFLDAEDKKLEDLLKNIHSSYISLQQVINKRLNDLEANKKKSSSELQKDIKISKHLYLNKNKKLKDDFDKNRKYYLEKLNKIYDDYQFNIHKLNAYYENLIKTYHEENKKRQISQSEKVNEQQKIRDEFLEFHKNDLVEARQNFYRTLNNVNSKINDVNALYKEIDEKLVDLFDKERKNINNKLIKNTDNLDKENQDILDEFEDNLKEIDKEILQLRQNHETNIDNLKSEFEKDITRLNIKLYKDRDLLNEEINNINNDESLNLKTKKNEIKRRKLTISKLQKTTKKNQETTTKKYKSDLITLVKQNVKDVQSQIFIRRIKDKNKNLSIKTNKKTLYIYENYYLNLLKTSTKEKDINKEIINTGLSTDITPLETTATLANYIYTTESNFYNQDQQDINLNLTRQIDLIEKESYLKELKLISANDRNQIEHDMQKSELTLNYHFNMEAEKNRRHFDYDVYLQKAEINNAIYNLEVLKNKHKQEIVVEKANHQKELSNMLVDIEKEKSTIQSNIYKENSNYANTSKQHELQNLNNNANLKKDFKHQNLYHFKTVSDLRNQRKIVFNIQNNIKKIVLSIKNSQKDDHEDVILHKQGLFNSSIELLKEAINEASNTTKKYFEDQLTTLSEQKYHQDYEKLLNEYNRKIQTVSKTLENYNEQLNSYTANQAGILNKIQTIKDDNLTHNNAISLIKQKIREARRNGNDENAIKAYRLEINVKQKQIDRNRESIKLYTKQTKQINRRVFMFQIQITELNKEINSLNAEKIRQENTLKRTLESEGRLYYRGINYVESKVNKLFKYIDKTNIFYAELITSFANKNYYNKQYIKFSKRLFNQNKKIHNHFLKLNEAISKITKYNLNKSEQDLHNLAKSYKDSTVKINKEHLNEIKRLTLSLNKLEKYKKKTVKLYISRFKLLLRKIQTKQQEETNNLSNIKQTLEKQLKDRESDYLFFEKSFNMNRQQAISNESNKLKEKLRKTEKANEKRNKQSNNRLIAAQEELDDFNYRRQLQLNYINKMDKENRKQLDKRQIALIKQQENKVNDLIKEKPKLDKINKKNENHLYKQLRKLNNKAKLKKRSTYINQKALLPLVIGRAQTKALRELEEKKSD